MGEAGFQRTRKLLQYMLHCKYWRDKVSMVNAIQCGVKVRSWPTEIPLTPAGARLVGKEPCKVPHATPHGRLAPKPIADFFKAQQQEVGG